MMDPAFWFIDSMSEDALEGRRILVSFSTSPGIPADSPHVAADPLGI
jgi:hypothetical protein